MIMYWIMAACFYPVLLILYAVMRYYAKPRNGLLFGARLQESWIKDAAVSAILRRFHRSLLIVLLAAALVALPIALIPYVSVCCLLWIIWVLAALVAMELPFAWANRAVRSWKAEQGLDTGVSALRLAELRPAGSVRCVKAWAFVPPTCVSLAGVGLTAWALRGQGLGFVTVTQLSFALITPLFGLIAWWMDRQRVRVISGDSETNLNYNRAMRMLWKKFWLCCVWLNTLLVAVLAVVFWLCPYDAAMQVVVWGAVTESGMILLAAIALMKGKSDLDSAYRNRMDLTGSVDDDSNWIWGMMYYNPKDTRAMVEKRVGVGTTINMASGGGKALVVFLIAVFVGMFAILGWTVRLEFTPVALGIEENALVATQLGEDYHIPLEEIQNPVLVHELPNWSRTNGTGMSNLCKGSYRIRATGERCEVFLNPQNSVFITFTAGNTTYYFGDTTDEETLELYDALTGQ